MNNLSNISSCRDIKPYEAKLSLENYLLPIFFTITSLVGVIGNTTVIYIIVLKPEMRTVPNLLIANLSLGDMVFIFGHMSFSIPSYVLGSFYGGIFLCRLIVFIKGSTLGVSIFTLTFMAVDRFRAITRPLHQQALSRLSVMMIMLSIWIFSMAASLPSTVLTFVENLVFMLSNDSCSMLTYCSSENEYFSTILWIKFALYFVAPFFVISFCYICISTTLCKGQNSPTLIVSNAIDSNYAILRRQMDARRKLSVVVLALVAAFVLCRLPYESHSIFLLLRKESIQTWVSTGTVLLYIYSSINPLILCILSSTFRRSMLKILCRCFVHPVQNHPTNNNSTQAIYSRVNRSPSPCKVPVGL